MSGYASTEFENAFSPATALRQVARSVDFGGRSTRTEVIAYWFFAFLAAIALFVVGLLAGLGDSPKQWWLLIAISVLITVPEPALFVRRLHDQDRTGWWALLLVPYFGLAWFGGPRTHRPAWEHLIVALLSIAILILLLLPASPDANRFGRDPRIVS